MGYDLSVGDSVILKRVPEERSYLLKFGVKYRSATVNRTVTLRPGQSRIYDYVVLFTDYVINKEASREEVELIRNLRETEGNTLVIAREDLPRWGFDVKCRHCGIMASRNEMVNMCDHHRMCRTHVLEYWAGVHPDVQSRCIKRHLVEAYDFVRRFNVRDDALWEFRALLCFGETGHRGIARESPAYDKFMAKAMNTSQMDCPTCVVAADVTGRMPSKRDLMSVFMQLYGDTYSEDSSLYPPLPVLTLAELSGDEHRALKVALHGKPYQFIWQIQEDIRALKRLAAAAGGEIGQTQRSNDAAARNEYRRVSRLSQEQPKVQVEGRIVGSETDVKATPSREDEKFSDRADQAKALSSYKSRHEQMKHRAEAEKVRIMEQYRRERETGLSSAEKQRFVERLDQGRKSIATEPVVEINRRAGAENDSADLHTRSDRYSDMTKAFPVTVFCPKKGYFMSVANYNPLKVSLSVARSIGWTEMYHVLIGAVVDALHLHTVDRAQALLWLCETEQGDGVAESPLNEHEPPPGLFGDVAEWLQEQFEDGNTGVLVTFTVDSIRLPQTLANNPFVGPEDGAALAPYYHRWRVIRGDGNCYYRSVYFAVLEQIVSSGQNSLLSTLADALNELPRILFRGSDEWASHQELILVLEKEDGVQWLTTKGLEAQLLDESGPVNLDKAFIKACRCLVAHFLEKHMHDGVDPDDESKGKWKDYAEMDFADDPGTAAGAKFSMDVFLNRCVMTEGAYVPDVVCNTGLIPRLLGDFQCKTWVLDHGGSPIRQELSNPMGRAGCIHLLFLHTKSAAARHYEVLCPV